MWNILGNHLVIFVREDVFSEVLFICLLCLMDLPLKWGEDVLNHSISPCFPGQGQCSVGNCAHILCSLFCSPFPSYFDPSNLHFPVSLLLSLPVCRHPLCTHPFIENFYFFIFFFIYYPMQNLAQTCLRHMHWHVQYQWFIHNLIFLIKYAVTQNILYCWKRSSLYQLLKVSGKSIEIRSTFWKG